MGLGVELVANVGCSACFEVEAVGEVDYGGIVVVDAFSF